jgi:hypothetical protein
MFIERSYAFFRLLRRSRQRKMLNGDATAGNRQGRGWKAVDFSAVCAAPLALGNFLPLSQG